MIERLTIRVTAPDFVCGVIVEQRGLMTPALVVDVAPKLDYMRGWAMGEVVDYCQRKGWAVESLP